MGILTVATINRNRLRGCTLKSDKELSKAGRGAYDVKYEMTSGMAIVKWYDNKAVLLASSFIGPDPVDRCRRWSKRRRYMWKWTDPTLSRCTITTWEESTWQTCLQLSIALKSAHVVGILRILYYLIDLSVVNGWLLYRRHLTQKQEKKYMPLLVFRAQVADALIKVGKQADLNSRKRGRPSLEDAPEPHQAASPPPPLQRIVAPSVDVRLDRFDHFPSMLINVDDADCARLVTRKWPA